MPKNNPSVKERLAILEIKLSELQEEFDKFIQNDFKHLRDRVDWILWVFILGTLMTILLNLIK